MYSVCKKLGKYTLPCRGFFRKDGYEMMNLIDLHCDTISRLMTAGGSHNLADNDLSIDLGGMQKAGTLVQFFACFVHAVSYEDAGLTDGSTGRHMPAQISPKAWDRAYQAVLEMAGRIDGEQNDRIRTAHSYGEIRKNQEQGMISAVKTAEEGGILNGRLERLEELYDAGIRLITLTWNYPNCLGFPNSRTGDIMESGLTEFGFQAVERMNELGMIVDVSHLSDGGFWDCIKASCVPVCASHSNARALCPHPRNLTDEMLKALGEKGGVAGLNFYPAFLCENSVAVVDDIARHAVHMIKTGGEDVAAVGTDFDGFDNEPHEGWISHVSEMELVWEAMRKRGITPRQLDKVMSLNALRVIREAMK